MSGVSLRCCSFCSSFRFGTPLAGLLLLLLLQLLPVRRTAAGQEGQAPTASAVAPVAASEMYRPTAMPDRIVLTWTGDPTTTQAVTWRTSTSVAEGFAEITVADAGPALEASTARLVAETQVLETNLNTAHFHTVNFSGLTPATTYAYRLGDGANWSEWFQFRTAGDQPEPFSFIYFGDAQNDLRSRWSRVIREAYRGAPRAKFMIHAGDLINTAESDAEWGEWFGAGAWLNAMVPSIVVPGNHEQAKLDGGSRRLSHHWRPQFALPENGPAGLEETCYTLVYQNMRIIGLDSNRMQAEQVAWLDQVLTENKSPWVVCTFHHPMFSTGKDRDNAELRALWKPVLDKHRVDLVLQGHDHTYGRTGLETPAEKSPATGTSAADIYSGTVYVVSVSGPKMYSLQRHPFMNRHAENTQLYQIIHVDGDTLHFEAYTAVGELYDAFMLEKQAGRPNRITEQVPDTPERLLPPVKADPPRKASAAFSR